MYELSEGAWESPNGRPMRFRYRAGTNDWNTINACLGWNDEYHLRGRQVSGWAIDIGGYLGSVGVALAVDNPECRVLIVEPVPWNASLIVENAEMNGVSDRVTLYAGAVGPPGITTSEIRFAYTGSESLEHHAFVGNTSLAYDQDDKPHESVSVETLGLAALLERYALAEPAFTKIDCEGAEWAFLDTPDVKWLPYIIGEAHAVRGHRGKDIAQLLAETHEVTLDGDAEGTCEFVAVRR